MITQPFALYKRYPMPEGFSIRLIILGTGYEMLIVESDCPEAFAVLSRDVSLARTLPIIFDTPEKYYGIDFINGGVFKQTVFHGRNVLYSPQVTFKTVDTLTFIERKHDWEQLLHEEKNKKETNETKPS